MINSTEIVMNILKFKGFRGATLGEKVRWLLVLYPFFLFVTLLQFADRAIYNITRRRKR
jgi:hypothetical protein